ncbi:hypothetical protein [Apilactobacillus xinyiensis]|uniref:hypothetical protein n=1 Tax=Apilactobacillus xinyiensis TaxID=2841032 RepID=UPI001C7DCD11|nr:hypothetical protein [Apilactobacillus xinyiensis]
MKEVEILMSKVTFNEEVFDFIKKSSFSNKGIALKDIVNAFSINHSSDSIRGVVNNMVDKGYIVRVNRGVYSLPNKVKSDYNDLLINSIIHDLSKYELGTDEYFELSDSQQKKYRDLRGQLKKVISQFC